MVSAWASQNAPTPVPGTGQALGQVKTGEKSNEITAIPQLLELLDLHGCIAAIDAMGCQKEIARKIIGAGADCVPAVKENQSQLYEDVRDLFEGAEALGFEGVPYDYSHAPVSSTGQALEKGHGRTEKRECWVITDPECLDYLQTGKRWPCLKSVVKVAGRRDTGQGAVSQPRYYISSLDASAHRLLSVIRSHWSIENSHHWTLDATFREDQCRVRKSLPP